MPLRLRPDIATTDTDDGWSCSTNALGATGKYDAAGINRRFECHGFNATGSMPRVQFHGFNSTGSIPQRREGERPQAPAQMPGLGGGAQHHAGEEVGAEA